MGSISDYYACELGAVSSVFSSCYHLSKSFYIFYSLVFGHFLQVLFYLKYS